MSSTQLRPAIKIKHGFTNEFKNEALNYALSFIDFNNITLNLRNEIGILYEKTQEYYHNKSDIKYKINLDDIAILLSKNADSQVSKSTVQYHYQRYKAQKEGKINVNGRPKPLTQAEIEEVGKYIDDMILPPRPEEIIDYIAEKYKKKRLIKEV